MVVDIGMVLAQWESAGIFDFLLPFLLIFAIVFGILTTTNILGPNKGIHTIIAFVIGLLALRLPIVSAFFAEVFPRLGVGIAVMLVLLVLVGMFVPDNEKRYWAWGLGAIGVIIAIVVITQSFDQYGWYSSYNFQDNIAWIIGGIILVGLIIAVSAASNPSTGSKPNAVFGPWFANPNGK